jgi:hypothetical protein
VPFYIAYINYYLTDDVGHGTHVAGIIAASKNSIGIMGAADPRIKIMPLKVINNSVNGFVYNGKLITDVIADAAVLPCAYHCRSARHTLLHAPPQRPRATG